MKNIKIPAAFIVIIILACSKSGNTSSGSATPPPPSAAIVKGADISWVTQMEANGIKFYNKSGLKEDPFQLMKELGINTIRLRVWVNPANEWNSTADVVAKAVRAKKAGLQLMIDFHYSDSWADPENKLNQLPGLHRISVHNHTVSVLNALKAVSVTPEWVQVGNETNDGMLWPEGRASANMANFAALINTGYNAVKSVDATVKVIVHLSNGYDNKMYRWMFDGLKANGAKWDIIGMSLYPAAADWQTLNAQCLSNMNDMVSRYNKPVMICETGMRWTDSTTCNSFLTDIINKTKSVTNSMGLGILYWEPQCYNNWQAYALGAFDKAGRPTIALDAFK